MSDNENTTTTPSGGWFVKKPIPVRCDQWFKNGDHPEDNLPPNDKILSGERYEGRVVRYFRHPDRDGQSECQHCSRVMHDHGFRWVSIEPMLDAIDLCNCYPGGFTPDTYEGVQEHCWIHGRRALAWVVVGGESGPGARRMDPSWAASLQHQCQQAGVSYFFKQAGTILAREWGGKGAGEDPSGWPEQFPREYPS